MSIKISSLQYVVNAKTLLDNIHLEIPSRQLTVLIGPNGAGKSTLLKTCCGDIQPTAGVITLNDKPLSAFSPHELAQTRAVLTQSYELAFNFSVTEVIQMGCFGYAETLNQRQQHAIVEEVMEFLHIAPLANRSFSALSGGEKQRVQLARVLTQLWHPKQTTKPRFLLLDEPTSSLDIFYQYQTLMLAKQLTQRGIGVIVVLHDLALAASHADNIVLLSHGKIVAKGSATTVLSSEHLLSTYQIAANLYQHDTQCFPTLLVGKNSATKATAA